MKKHSCESDFSVPEDVVQKAKEMSEALHSFCVEHQLPLVTLVGIGVKTDSEGHSYQLMAMTHTTRSCRTAPLIQMAERAVSDGFAAAVAYGLFNGPNTEVSNVTEIGGPAQ